VVKCPVFGIEFPSVGRFVEEGATEFLREKRLLVDALLGRIDGDSVRI
jgi:hypothetical protein